MGTKARYGAANHMWKGGRVVASNGYVLIRVGTGHHLSDVRGYAYEHRLIAEQKIGRRLRPSEVPHHINGVKADNRPENIEVMASRFHHHVKHRRRTSNRRLPEQPNELITCACGCGAQFMRFDSCGRPRRFRSGHNIQRGSRGRIVAVDELLCVAEAK